jgi:hypothetical protein
MDTTDYPSLPSLTRLHAQLAVDSRRVEQIVDGQADVIERLFHATIAEDWAGVTNATRLLANLKPGQITAEVVDEARKLYEELTHEQAGLRKPKHLANLLAACRAVRSRSRRA